MSSRPIPVLLVDDQPLVAAAMRRLLAASPGFEMRHCVDPCQAEAEVAATAPAVVMVDLVMPVLGGLELVARLRRNPVTAAVPVVVMSSIDEPIVKAEALDAGADDYLVKLPDAVELGARLRALVRRAGWAGPAVSTPRR